MGRLFSQGQRLGSGVLSTETHGGYDSCLCAEVSGTTATQDRLPRDCGQKTLRRGIARPQSAKARLLGPETHQHTSSVGAVNNFYEKTLFKTENNSCSIFNCIVPAPGEGWGEGELPF